MSGSNSGRGLRRKPKEFDAELDALVAREAEALSARCPGPGGKHRGQDNGPAADAARMEIQSPTPNDGQLGPTARTRRSEPSPRPQRDNLIGIRHGRSIGAAGIIPFSTDEEAFIEQAVAFLRGCENADVIIEDIWTNVVVDRDGDPDELAEGDDGGDDIIVETETETQTVTPDAYSPPDGHEPDDDARSDTLDRDPITSIGGSAMRNRSTSAHAPDSSALKPASPSRSRPKAQPGAPGSDGAEK